MLFSLGDWLARRLHPLARGRRIVPLLAVVLLGTAVLPASRAASPQTPVTEQSCRGDTGTTIRVLHAGSITNLVTGTMRPAFQERCGADVADLSGPSVALADGIKSGSISGDVFMSADAHLNRTLMGPRNGDWARWFLVFGRNEEVITYSARSRFFADLEKARLGEVPWYQVVMEPGLVLGRTDPNTDPGGYYALFVAGLAERYYAIPGLKERLLGADTNPAQLLAPPTFARTQTGASPDATFGYLSSALDQNLNYIVLPRQINLGDPGEASRYAKVSFTNTDGTTLTGAPIADSVTVLERSAQRQTAVDFVRLLVSEQGRAFVQSRDFLAGPVLVGGDVSALPGELAPFVEGCFERSHCELGSRTRQNAN